MVNQRARLTPGSAGDRHEVGAIADPVRAAVGPPAYVRGLQGDHRAVEQSVEAAERAAVLIRHQDAAPEPGITPLGPQALGKAGSEADLGVLAAQGGHAGSER